MRNIINIINEEKEIKYIYVRIKREKRNGFHAQRKGRLSVNE